VIAKQYAAMSPGHLCDFGEEGGRGGTRSEGSLLAIGLSPSSKADCPRGTARGDRPKGSALFERNRLAVPPSPSSPSTKIGACAVRVKWRREKCSLGNQRNAAG